MDDSCLHSFCLVILCFCRVIEAPDIAPQHSSFDHYLIKSYFEVAKSSLVCYMYTGREAKCIDQYEYCNRKNILSSYRVVTEAPT